MPFEKGASGNPRGRPKGIRDRRHDLRDRLTARAPELVDKAVDLALAGDIQAIRLCLDRVIPAYRLQAPEVDVNGDTLADQVSAVTAAICRGEITAGEGARLIDYLTKASKILEAAVFKESVGLPI